MAVGTGHFQTVGEQAGGIAKQHQVILRAGDGHVVQASIGFFQGPDTLRLLEAPLVKTIVPSEQCGYRAALLRAAGHVLTQRGTRQTCVLPGLFLAARRFGTR